MTEDTSGVRLEVRTGDIAGQPDLEAIVNAANAELMPGGGVAGAIHRAAGPGLAEECRPLAPIRPGQAVISRGHDLPNAWVVHCLGPVYGADEPADRLLADCYRRALALAEERDISSIGFPAISTGAFGYPAEAASEVCARTLAQSLAGLHRVRRVRFVLFDEPMAHLVARAFRQAGLNPL